MPDAPPPAPEPAAPRRRAGPPPSPDLRPREVLGWIVAGLALALLVTWPLVANLSTHVPGDLVDPLAEAWELSWGGHALRTDPGRLWQGNVFHPAPDSYAFSDSLLGYAPLALFGSGTGAALVRYNVAFVLAFALCFTATGLLARELGVRRVAAAVAGAAFAYAPWRAAHDGHLNILSVGGIPLTAFLLLRGYRRRSPTLVVAGWLAAAWQLSLGFAMGIYFSYALALGCAVATLLWWRDGRRSPGRRVVVATVVGVALFGAAAGLLVRPYLRVVDRYPTAQRSLVAVDFYSPHPRSLLAAPADNKVWGERTAKVRQRLRWPPEQTLFPGLAVTALAAVGLAVGPLTRRRRLLLGAAIVVSTALSFGTALEGGRWTYRPLYEHAPGWSALRTPGRIVVFTSLALALAAAAGTHRLVGAVSPEPGRHLRGRPRLVGERPAAVLAAAAAALVVWEGAWSLDLPAAPRPPAGWPGTTEPAAHLPAVFNFDARYMFWSTEGFPRITNGNTSFLPPELDRLRDALEGFPDATSVALLEELGVRHVVVHPTLLPGTRFADVLDRPTTGLPLRVERRGELVVYVLG